MTKTEMRKMLNSGMAVYLGSGGHITKCPPADSRKRANYKKEVIEQEEEIVEIEVDHLPAALRKKYFDEA